MKKMKQQSFASINPFHSNTNSASRKIFMMYHIYIYVYVYFETILLIVT